MNTNDRKNTNKTRNEPSGKDSRPVNKIKTEKLKADTPGKPEKAPRAKAKVRRTVEPQHPASEIQPLTTHNSPLTTMEIHHHPQLEHKHKPWKEYLLEGLMIFIAVMMGFIAENIREDITNSQHVKQLTSQLVKDLKADTTQLNGIDRGETQIVKYNDTLINLLQQPLEKVDTRRVQKLVADSHSMWLFSASTGAISAIKNELHLKQFSNSGIIGLFSGYEGRIELLHTDQSINLQYQRIYLDPFITQHFTPANMVAAFDKFSVTNSQMRNLTQADIDQLAADMVLIRIISKEMVRDNKTVRKDAVDLLHYVIKQYNLQDKVGKSLPAAYGDALNNTTMKMLRVIYFAFALILMAIGKTIGQAHAGTIPAIVEKNGHHALMVDGKPFLILGGQAHNSSAWPGMLPQLWSAINEMHANTLEVPIYWEQIEAQPGKLDFSLVDTLLTQAREHNVHLVLLWFATWKNGSNHYMPEWMKRDAGKYPNITGKNGQPVDSPSPNVKATMEADIKAFTAVMKYLKKADAQHTVIMVQVENESGAWDSVRDYSPIAQKLFEGPVPAELLTPGILKALNVPVVSGGSWQKVFGDRADEYFQAWSVARFIGQVAAAGKAEYPLPMYVNAALRDPLTNPSATTYESGGPTDNVIPIWKIAAPAIDLVAPDIYLSGSEKVLKVIDLYDRPDNTLFVPEAGLIKDNAKYLYEVIARGGIGFSPFGIDDNGQGSAKAENDERLAPFAQEYTVITPMMRELAQWGFEGRVKAVVEREDHAAQTIDLGAWQAIISFGTGGGNAMHPNTQPNGKMMIVKVSENKFIVIGTLCHVTFLPTGGNSGRAWQYLKVEEGHYENGEFKLLRILNGDETDWGGPRFGTAPTVLQTTLIVR